MAASCGIVDYKSALRRMSLRCYGLAAREWNSEGLCEIAKFLDVAIHRAAKLEEPFQRVLEIDVRRDDEVKPDNWCLIGIHLRTEREPREEIGDYQRGVPKTPKRGS